MDWTHENGPMRFMGSSAILASSVGQNLNSRRLNLLERGELGYTHEKREKQREKREGRKRVGQSGARLDVFFPSPSSSSSDLQVVSRKRSQGKPRNK